MNESARQPADLAQGPSALASAWTIALDTLAGAASVAVEASAEQGLLSGTATALQGRFADWAFVDLIDGQHAARAVAARDRDPGLEVGLSQIAAHACPLISLALRRCTPVLRQARPDDPMLGSLPGGRTVSDAIGARFVACGPIIIDGAACGAVTVARSKNSWPLGFLELGVMALVGELAGAAAQRIRQP
ncbi:MAG TPA: hypothetical protein VG253_01330 [Streptosporangiaceae bacterium]|nr:hypothetical protein [Streptosporangiaceae bacterium]